jgi:hypothetical protein
MKDSRDDRTTSTRALPDAQSVNDGTTAKASGRDHVYSRSRYLDAAMLWWRAAPTYSARFSWAKLGMACLRTACCGAILFATLAHIRPLPHVDLYPSYVAAHLANDQRWDHIYHRSIWLYGNEDPEWDRRAQTLLNGPLHGTSFVYHPWYLSALRPIASRVGYETFQRGSVWFNKACIVFAALATALLLRWHTLPRQLFLTLVLGVASSTIYGIELGQNVLPALAFSLAAIVTWRSRAPLLLAGAFAALAWTCKPWCAAIVLLCFLFRGVRAGVLTTAILGGIMVLLPGMVMPDVLMRDYQAMNLALTKVSVSGWNNLSVLSIFERFAYSDWSQHLHEWLPRRADPTLRAGALGVSVAVFLLAALIWWRRRPAPDWTGAAWLAFMLMPLGICWTHYFIFAFPLAFITALSERSPPALRVLGLGLLALLLAIQVTYDVPPAEYYSYLVKPAGYPWLRTLPMLLIGSLVLSALWFAPSARVEDET